jgi:hypothetical protein
MLLDELLVVELLELLDSFELLSALLLLIDEDVILDVEDAYELLEVEVA